MINFNSHVLARSPLSGDFSVEQGKITDVFPLHSVTLYEVTFNDGRKEIHEDDALVDTAELDEWYDSVAATRAAYNDAVFELQHTMDGLPRV